VTTPERGGGGELAVVLVVYVVPLLLTVGGLWAVGLHVLAGALLAVELVVAAAVVAVRRRPLASGPSRRPWLVPVAMVGCLGAIVALAAWASTAG
jgi:amino acid transporter